MRVIKNTISVGVGNLFNDTVTAIGRSRDETISETRSHDADSDCGAVTVNCLGNG